MEYYDNNDASQNTASENEKYGRSRQNRNSMAVASLLCGITGALLLCSCVAFPASILCGVAAISLALLSRKGQPMSGYAIAGLVFGIVSLLLGLAECAYLIAVSALIRDPEFAPIFDEVMQQYEALMQPK